MKQIPITNFLRMSPDVGQYTSKLQNYLVAANPLYYLDNPGIQEEQTAPLAAALKWQQITESLDGSIVHMIASTDPTSFMVYAITTTTRVYGITTTTVSDLGFPSGSTTNSTGGRLAIGGGYLFAVWSGQVYKMQLPSGAWSTVGSSISSPGGVHHLEPFLDFICLADSTSGGNSYHLLKKIDVSAFTISAGIDIGVGWGITGVKNYNGKYVAIAAGQTATNGGVFGYARNYLFLWDGISGTYNYAVKIPGKYISMKVIDSVLYMAIMTSNSTSALYYLSGTKLKKVFDPAYSTINGSAGLLSAVPDPVFDYQGTIGLRLDATTDFNIPGATPPILMIRAQEAAGVAEFILSSGLNFDQFVVGYDGILYGATAPLGGVGNGDLYFYPNTGTSYQNILYRSQWVPTKNLQAIDIYYDTPPQSGTDAINVTIFGKGEDIIAGSSTTVLQSITPTQFLNKKRTRLDVQGFVGSELVVQLSTVNEGTWRPIIRGIVPIVQ